MDKLLIRGGRRLHGTVTVSGAKNMSPASTPPMRYASKALRASSTFSCDIGYRGARDIVGASISQSRVCATTESPRRRALCGACS